MHIPAEPAERSRPGMSTDRITAAALQIVDTEGSQALTMRRLGQALDRKVMTLYRYVPSKDALLDGVVARVLTDLAINPAAADWPASWGQRWRAWAVRRWRSEVLVDSGGLAMSASCPNWRFRLGLTGNLRRRAAAHAAVGLLSSRSASLQP
jgi:AcrR family transcriptional regulator